MKKFSFPAEILCLFFIICVSVLFGKLLIDVKNVVGDKLEKFLLIPQPAIVVDYQAYSYRYRKEIEGLQELTILKSEEDLKDLIDELEKDDIKVKWLNKKLDSIDKEVFKEKNIAVICVVNDNNVTSIRIGDVYKQKDDITVQVVRTISDKTPTKKFTWLSVIEITDIESDIYLEY